MKRCHIQSELHRNAFMFIQWTNWQTTDMRDHLSWRTIFLAEGPTFQCNWTCHQRPPALRDHIFMANDMLFIKTGCTAHKYYEYYLPVTSVGKGICQMLKSPLVLPVVRYSLCMPHLVIGHLLPAGLTKPGNWNTAGTSVQSTLTVPWRSYLWPGSWKISTLN